MPSQRYKLTISYRGTAYHGWQVQTANALWKGPKPPPGHGIPTIQEKLRRALRFVVGHEVNLVGSSRTDAGVHAKGQVAHFDCHEVIPPEGLRLAVNHQLPDDILVRTLEPVPDSFEASYSTISKRYQYVIWNAIDRPPLFADMVWHRWQELNIDAMQSAAAHFVGQHDFTSFARAGHGRETAIRTIHSFTLSHRSPRLVFGVEGNGFLWQMVRIMVGTLVQVGLGLFPPEIIPTMLAAKDRRAAGLTAPPQGLYLQWIQTNEMAPRTTNDQAADFPG
jgi:tRNA pseudouridine38-40 synthase